MDHRVRTIRTLFVLALTVVVAGGRLLSVMAFTVANGRVAAIDVLFDPDRLAGLDLAVLDDPP